jgi:hypothetical protein
MRPQSFARAGAIARSAGEEYDYLTTPEDGARTAGYLPGADFIEMKESGRFPMSENYQVFRGYQAQALERSGSRAAARAWSSVPTSVSGWRPRPLVLRRRPSACAGQSAPDKEWEAPVALLAPTGRRGRTIRTSVG